MIADKRIDVLAFFRITWKNISVYLIYATVVVYVSSLYEYKLVLITGESVGILGAGLAIFLSFRNNAAYDRWWEARKLWGSLVNQSRSFARQVITMIPTDRTVLADDAVKELHREMIYRQIAFVNSLRLHLRRQPITFQLKRFLGKGEQRDVTRAANAPNLLLQRQGERLRGARESGLLDNFHSTRIDHTMEEFTTILGACERIKNTPFPRQYDRSTELFLYVYCILLPVSIVDEIGWWTVPLATLISTVFFVLNIIGEQIEDPFENKVSDVPLTALCRTIEVSLREQLGETDIPAGPRPRKGVLM